ncbi:uncharacterized protein N7518_002751 [Penicillium psychrosexuale]|uniref:uncharacterized protein n=1 Tax=Penicillium psychrosexuale TaxID=1002107 RepID=UPI0025457E7E|nr:uncharacterized protein N7518_002751 [Penicillium psychrosexuale]KAJ5800683.1 hypothetical protein N7518_002751 [Penicillium psychrosexuale]
MASASQQKCARVLSIVASEDIRELDWSHIHLLVSTSAKCATKRLTLVLVNNVFVARSEARSSLFPYVQHYVTTITSLAQTSVESATVAIDVLLFGWSDLQLSAYTWDQVYSNSPSHVKQIIGDAPYCQIEPIIRVLPSTNTERMCADDIAIDTVSASPSDPSHKKLHQLSESFERRQSAVRQFIEGFQTFERRPFELKVVPRQNYGPQVSEPKLDAVVLSTESMHHGVIVNRLRVEADLPPVRVFVVDVVQAAGSTFSYDNAHKLMTRMSSSLIRESLDKRALKFILLNGFAGVGKFTIASKLATYLAFAGLEARVVHNHLLADLADAVRSKTAPTYQTFRRQLRDLVFDAISTDEHILPGTAFVFTGNFSQSMVGQTAAQEYATAASRCGASFIPVTIHCNIEELERRIVSRSRSEVSSRKLLDPARGAKIATQKVLYIFENTQALSLDVSLMSAEQAAKRIAEHVEKVHQKREI